MTAFCSLCASTDPAGLGQVIGICLDATACHQRQYARLRDRADEATARAEAAGARLDEIRRLIGTYFVVHGNSNAASLVHARDLAEGIRQVLDREPAP